LNKGLSCNETIDYQINHIDKLVYNVEVVLFEV